jgi:hypothetical protein
VAGRAARRVDHDRAPAYRSGVLGRVRCADPAPDRGRPHRPPRGRLVVLALNRCLPPDCGASKAALARTSRRRVAPPMQRVRADIGSGDPASEAVSGAHGGSNPVRATRHAVISRFVRQLFAISPSASRIVRHLRESSVIFANSASLHRVSSSVLVRCDIGIPGRRAEDGP